MSPVLVVGQDHLPLTRRIATELNAQVVTFTAIQFADAEAFVSLASPEKISQAQIVVVYQFSPRSSKESGTYVGSINDQLMGLFECIDQLKILGARSIKVILPYLPYARHDHSSCKKYDGAAFMVGRCLRALGAQSMYASDVHAVSMCPDYPLPLHNLSLEAFWNNVILQKIIKQRSMYDFCIVSPDEGGRDRANKIASLLGLESAFMRKMRTTVDVAVSYELVGDVGGKQVILIDDIVDTARTAISACDLLLNQGATNVYGCFTHAVLASGAMDRLMASQFTKIFVTDTVIGNGQKPDDKVEVVSVNDFFAESMRDLVGQTSIF